MTSYWDDIFLPEAAAEYRGGFRRSAYDVAIIGGGIIGMSTAIELKERDPSLHVVVIERSYPPKGASTRNAGFACFGSLSEIAHDVDLMGADRARDLVRRRLEGLITLRERCGDDQIDYEQHGGHEIFLEPHPALVRLDEINALLAPLFHGPAFERRDDLIDHFGFNGVHALVRTPFEGTLHSGKMIKRLWQIAARHNIDIQIGEVLGHSATQAGAYELHVDSREVSIQTSRIVLATNALLDASSLRPTGALCDQREPPASTASALQPKVAPCEHSEPPASTASLLQPKVALCDQREPPASTASPTPGRGQILLTESMFGLPLRGSFHMNEGYVYFRNVGERILLGGGRDQAFNEERTTEFGVTDTIQQYLENLLHTVIAPDKPPAIERRWSGIMGFRDDKQPFVQEVAPGIIQAFGCNGMGVALGSSIGAEAAEGSLRSQGAH